MKIFNQIQIMRKVHSTIFEKISLKYNLTECEIMILMFLDENENQDMATDIVKSLMISKAHVSALVNNLENQGYIIKNIDSKDRKKIHLEVTEKARVIVKAVKKEKKRMKDTIFCDLTKGEIETMQKVLNKIKKNLKANYDIELI